MDDIIRYRKKLPFSTYLNVGVFDHGSPFGVMFDFFPWGRGNSGIFFTMYMFGLAFQTEVVWGKPPHWATK